MPDLSIVIVNWNTKDLLDQCLGALRESVLKGGYQVIVVDNHSSDGSSAMVKEKYSFVKLVENDENLGYGKAYNQGTKLAEGRYILHLNSDTVVSQETLENMVEFMDSHPDAGIASCKLVTSHGRLDRPCKRSFPTPMTSLYQAIGLTRLFPRSRIFSYYYLGHLDPDQVHEVDSVMGAFLMIRAEAVKQVGLLDEQFYIYGEDLDWCLRVKEAGWKVYYNPAATAVHQHGASSEKLSYKMIWHFHRSMILYYKKHHANRQLFLVGWFVYLGIWARYLKCITVNIFKKKKSVV